jgi:hypothetical protein
MKEKRTRKINARITSEIEKQLLEIVKNSGSTMSDVIMKAISHYYQVSPLTPPDTPYEIAKANKLIGCAKGPKTLSINYKQELTEILSKKHDYS